MQKNPFQFCGPLCDLSLVLCIHGSSKSADPTNWEPCSPVAFTLEKYFYTGGPVQFKPMLFKGQLYKSVLLRKIEGIPWRSSG